MRCLVGVLVLLSLQGLDGVYDGMYFVMCLLIFVDMLGSSLFLLVPLLTMTGVYLRGRPLPFCPGFGPPGGIPIL